MDYSSILKPSQAEQTEKRSRFIARIIPVSHIDEVDKILQQVRNDYPGAAHYCWAYLIRGENNLLERYNDDGEPSGTAGLPILTVLKNSGLQDSGGGGSLFQEHWNWRFGTRLPRHTGGSFRYQRFVILCRRIDIRMIYQFYGFLKDFTSLYPADCDIQFTSQTVLAGYYCSGRIGFFELKEATAGQAAIG